MLNLSVLDQKKIQNHLMREVGKKNLYKKTLDLFLKKIMRARK